MRNTFQPDPGVGAWLRVKHKIFRIPEGSPDWPWYAVPVRKTIVGVARFFHRLRRRILG
jgi:hypothetical protein